MSLEQIDGATMSRPISAEGPYTPIAIEFGKRLQHYTSEKGWNQAALARHASKFLPKGKVFRRDSISLYMRGAQVPAPLRRMALCKALGVTEEDLIPQPVRSDAPPLGMKPLEGGNVWLQINQAVPMDTAVAIAALLKKRVK